MIKTYYLLTKPGIIFGNLITTASAFLLASRGDFRLGLFLATVVGLFGVIASACVFNNYIDREADSKMERTKDRALVRGLVSTRSALCFALVLGAGGLLVLSAYTNTLAVGAALTGFVIYVAMYSFWKYRTSYATLIGSISGAIPPVIGYFAAGNALDAGAILLFGILVLWQMPHFYSIAIYRFQEYSAAAIPVLPVEKGPLATKIQMLLYILAFLAATYLLYRFGYTGSLYLTAATLLGGAWLYLMIRGFKHTNDVVWARQMFAVSLVVIMGLSLAIAVEGFL